MRSRNTLRDYDYEHNGAVHAEAEARVAYRTARDRQQAKLRSLQEAAAALEAEIAGTQAAMQATGAQTGDRRSTTPRQGSLVRDFLSRQGSEGEILQSPGPPWQEANALANDLANDLTSERSARSQPRSHAERPYERMLEEATAQLDLDAAERPPLGRQYSERSQDTLHELEAISSHLDLLRARLDATEAKLDAAEGGASPLDAALRNTLAQIHGDCAKVISAGGTYSAAGRPMKVRPLDGMPTAELVSARDMARHTRKMLVVAAEGLLARIGEAVARFDRLKYTVGS